VGVILALFSLVPMLVSLRAGRWVDAVGPQRPTLVGALLILGGTILPSMFSYAAADLAPLLVSASLIGSGAALTMLSIQQVIGERADPARRPAAFAWFAMGASVSGFTGPVLSGMLIDAFGHRAAFGALVIVALLAVLLVWTSRDLMPSRHGRLEPPAPMHPLELLKIVELRHLLVATALISMSWDLQSFVIPVHGTQVGLSASEIGFVLGCFALATFVIRLAMPSLSQRFSEWQVLTFTLFCAALAFALFPLFSSSVTLMAIAFLLGLGLGAAQPNIMSLVHSSSPEGRVGEVLGVRSTVIHSNQVFLPLIFGAFGSVLGAAAMFWMMAALVFAGGVGAVRWNKHKNQAVTED
jgi:predicted MFS family arabinose efflux permease